MKIINRGDLCCLIKPARVKTKNGTWVNRRCVECDDPVCDECCQQYGNMHGIIYNMHRRCRKMHDGDKDPDVDWRKSEQRPQNPIIRNH